MFAVIYPEKLTKLFVKCLDPHAVEVVHVYLHPAAFGEKPLRNREIVRDYLNGGTYAELAHSNGVTGSAISAVVKRFVRATLPDLPYLAHQLPVARDRYRGWLLSALWKYQIREVLPPLQLSFDEKTTDFWFTGLLSTRFSRPPIRRHYRVKFQSDGAWRLYVGGEIVATGERGSANVAAAEKIIRDYSSSRTVRPAGGPNES